MKRQKIKRIARFRDKKCTFETLGKKVTICAVWMNMIDY